MLLLPYSILIVTSTVKLAVRYNVVFQEPDDPALSITAAALAATDSLFLFSGNGRSGWL